jgi:cell division protein FtsX
LLRLYPGALVISKEDRFSSAEANTKQVEVFLRAAALAAGALGFAAVFLLGRLQSMERRLETAKLKLLGATPHSLHWIGFHRGALGFVLASSIALPLCYALIELQRLRMGYFFPLSRTALSPSLPFVLAWFFAGFVILAMTFWTGQELHKQRPSTLLREEAFDVSAMQKWAMLLVLAFATAASGGLAAAYSEFLPVFAKSAFPSEDGVLVIGEGPPAEKEIQSVWARVHSAGQEQHTALATCSDFRKGALVEKAFADRLQLRLGDIVRIAAGRKMEALPVEAIENARGVAQYLRQMELPCRLIEGMPRFRLAWHSGSAGEIRRRLPQSVVNMTAAELRGRVEDLAARAIFFPQICAVYVALMSLLVIGATWRMILLARKNDFAVWRVLGATRSTVARRITGQWISALTAALATGGFAAWAWASALLTHLAGTQTFAPLYWIPLTGTFWGAIVLALWRVQLGGFLRERPLEILRAR